MQLFPAFFPMADATAVVFGGGETARRKVRLLAKTPARIVVVADALDQDFEVEFENRIQLVGPEKAYDALTGAAFAIVALEDEAAARAARDRAKAAGLPVNVVDRPELCDFTTPSIVDRGQLVAAFATGGAAPVLAKAVRETLEAALPARIGDLAALAKSLRPDVKAAIPTEDGRRRFWERALNGPAAEAAYAGDLGRAEALLRAELAAPADRGVVHIVGAGPGDPELLTLKALRLLQNADVVFHDRLVSDEIIDLIRRDAERVPVGKAKGDHSVPQDQIHALMIEAAAAGRRVVRLKGGDPFIFGRGGEELQALQAAGVEAHVVPGVSSALGCAASAGLPLTHRDHAQSATFVTGHAKSGGTPDLDWPALARANQTVVVFMGVGTAPAISANLLRAGRAASTPVAVIENGTRANEIRAYGTLVELPALIGRHGIKGPALLVIGEVAGLPLEALARQASEIAA